MAVINVNINCSAINIADLNSKCLSAANKNVTCNRLIDLLMALATNQYGSTITVTTRDTDAIAATSGTGSTQITLTT